MVLHKRAGEQAAAVLHYAEAFAEEYLSVEGFSVFCPPSRQPPHRPAGQDRTLHREGETDNDLLRVSASDMADSTRGAIRA